MKTLARTRNECRIIKAVRSKSTENAEQTQVYITPSSLPRRDRIHCRKDESFQVSWTQISISKRHLTSLVILGKFFNSFSYLKEGITVHRKV